MHDSYIRKFNLVEDLNLIYQRYFPNNVSEISYEIFVPSFQKESFEKGEFCCWVSEYLVVRFQYGKYLVRTCTGDSLESICDELNQLFNQSYRDTSEDEIRAYEELLESCDKGDLIRFSSSKN